MKSFSLKHRIILLFCLMTVLIMPLSAQKLTMDVLDKSYTEYYNNMILPDSLKKAETNEEFIRMNGAREGVITDKNDLQYLVVTEGNGLTYRHHDTDFIIYYNGFLRNGTLFDSSSTHGGPVQFGFNEVVRGLSTAVKKVPRGSRMIIYIPPKLGYGKKGIKGVIPSDAILIFDVEIP